MTFSTPEPMMSRRRSSRNSFCRRWTALIGGVALLHVTGCAIKTPPKPDAVSHAPLIVDEAMQQRHWPISVAQYSNGSTPAWPTGALLTHAPNAPVWQAAASDTPIFLGNVLLFPLDYFLTPPWQEVVYPLGEIEASYHAMPPLPPK